MTGLATWQACFSDALEGRQGEPAFDSLLADGCAVTPAQGLEIYRNNSRGVRARALQEIYPVCRRVLGADCFGAVVAQWIRMTPSVDGDLNLEGGGIPEVLDALVAERPEYTALPWLPDLARLERSLHQAYYRPNAPLLDLTPLESVADPGRLYPRLTPSLDLLRSDWPVLRIWEDHQPGGEPGPVADISGPWHLVIHRPHFQPRAEAVSVDLFSLLEACLEGCDLESLNGDPALVPELVSRGWLVGFSQVGDHVRP